MAYKALKSYLVSGPFFAIIEAMKIYILIASILFAYELRSQETPAEILAVLRQMTSATLADDIDPNQAIREVFRVCPTKEAAHSTLGNTCKSKTPPQLRNLFISFYESRKKNADPVKDKKEKELFAKSLAKLMGMVVKESSGNPSAVSDMNGKGSATSYKSFFKLNNSSGVMSRPHYSSTELLEKLINQSGVTFNKQTNFGLAQLSSDRLIIPKWGGNYLIEKQKMIKLMDGKTFVEWCMTKSIYKDSDAVLQKYFNDNIKNCEMGTSSSAKVKCFGRTINFCPRMSLELALEQPSSYFETRHASPICAELFK
jgi:hypothetical protein